jgi:dTDP-glucose 4,6-dehydratase
MGKGHDLIEFVKDRPGHDFRYSINSSKIKSLGWEPKYKFKDGIEQCISWYLANQWFLK